MTEDLLEKVQAIKSTVNEQLNKLIDRQELFQDLWNNDLSEKSFVAKEAYETPQFTRTVASCENHLG